MKNSHGKFFIGISIVIVIFFLIFWTLVSNKSTLVENTKVVIFGDTEIQVEVVDTLETRTQGLSGRTELKEGTGMLFIFESEGMYPFWMKDMNFSIDIIWIDENFKVGSIKERALPESYPEVFKPKYSALYVLEVNEGIVEKSGLKEGDLIKFR